MDRQNEGFSRSLSKELQNKSSRLRGLYLCAITTTIIIAVAVVVAIALGLTVFRPRDPNVEVYLVGLKDTNITDFMNPMNNVSTAMIIEINNVNYVGFEYEKAISLIWFRNEVVGQVLIEGKQVPARSQVNVSTAAVLMSSKLMTKAALDEMTGGFLNLTSNVTLHGRSSLMGMKVKASAHTECNMRLVVGIVMSGNSTCWSRLKVE
ncbi:Late embryogenesis abundant protein At1g64065 [Linum grandiflorum]